MINAKTGKYEWNAKDYSSVRVTGSKSKGWKVAFTGVRGHKLCEKIVAEGGTIQNSLTKETTHLITADDLNQMTSKMQKALDSGIEIVAIGKMCDKLGIEHSKDEN